MVVVAGSIALLALLRDGGTPSHTTSNVEPSPRRAEPASVPVATDARGDDAGDASRERQELLARVRSSGRGDEPWNAQAGDVFAAFARSGARVDEVGCYVVGCAATLTFESSADYRRFRSELDASDAYRAWTGGKRFTSPEADPQGARVTLAVVLYRPD